ncbi:DNA methyltransferase [Tundrisphaera sp. TA3]|uniref:DNA methyltransferase n=1 Tax=Tundrisphaera sp. TA3 TaxID=3435775 RepID=UPI003EC0C984
MKHRGRGGTLIERASMTVADEGVRTDVWPYGVGNNKSTKDNDVWGHGGVIPEVMAADLILPFSNPGDLCLDVMAGTGTTCKMALLNDRYYLGF